MKNTKQGKTGIEHLNHGRRVYDFFKFGRPIFYVCIALTVLAIAIFITKGFNRGLDFTGGNAVEISLSRAVPLDDIRRSLSKINYDEVVIQNFGSSTDIIIRMAPTPMEGVDGESMGSKIMAQLHKEIDPNAQIKRVEFVGPSVGDELAQDGVLAVFAALFFILLYTAFRFEWRLGLGAIAGLLFDVILTIGYLSFFQREIDLTIVAALLSIIGYSLNDTIVVFDRLRDNFRKIRRSNTYDLMNISFTQTLNRTIMTSGTTLVVVLCLYFLGGSMLEGFAETLAIGIILGTFSSIYVSAYLALKLGINREHLLPEKVEED